MQLHLVNMKLNLQTQFAKLNYYFFFIFQTFPPSNQKQWRSQELDANGFSSVHTMLCFVLIQTTLESVKKKQELCDICQRLYAIEKLNNCKYLQRKQI